MADYPFIELGSAEALRNFAYKGKRAAGIVGMQEDELKAAIKSALEHRGYEVAVVWGKGGGSDIVATSGNSRIVIEAKSEGASRQALGNNFLQVLGQILQRMSDDAAQYGVGLPAHASYIELVLKLPRRVRQSLRLDFYFVRPHNTTYEVGIFRWLVD
jgi:hypothetical protein